MISALIGAVVMSAVTVAMLLAVDVTDKALKKVGKYPLTIQERQILIDAGYSLEDIANINFVGYRHNQIYFCNIFVIFLLFVITEPHNF